jgi:hypothetical protein
MSNPVRTLTSVRFAALVSEGGRNPSTSGAFGRGPYRVGAVNEPVKSEAVTGLADRRKRPGVNRIGD